MKRAALLLFVSSLLSAQRFEAVNIAPADPTLPRSMISALGLGPRFIAQGMTVQQYLLHALRPARTEQVVGNLPPGVWNISAVVGDHVPRSTAAAMLLHALEDGFGLRAVVRQKEETACVLEVAPGGLKIQESKNQNAPETDASKEDMTTFAFTKSKRNVRGDDLVVLSLMGSHRCGGLPEVSDLPIDPGRKYDLDLTYVDRDFAERVGKTTMAEGPDRIAALKAQAGVLVSVKKHLTPYWYFEWSGKTPK